MVETSRSNLNADTSPKLYRSAVEKLGRGRTDSDVFVGKQDEQPLVPSRLFASLSKRPSLHV